MSADNQELALHTAEVKVGDKQTTNEATYKGYARVKAGNGHHYFADAQESGQRLTHYSIGSGGTISAVGELLPHTLTQEGAAPAIHIGE